MATIMVKLTEKCNLNFCFQNGSGSCSIDVNKTKIILDEISTFALVNVNYYEYGH